MRVLIVEDEQPKSAKICSVLMTLADVRVEDIVIATDATAAKRELRASFFDLAIVDIAIPWKADGGVQRDAGVRLVADIIGGEDFHQPLHMMGLTGFADLTAASAASIPRSVFSIEFFDETSTEWVRAVELRVRQVAAARAEIAAAGAEYSHTVGIICALDTPELSHILALPWSWSEEIVPRDPTIYHVGAFEVGDNRYSVVAAACARMGLTAAAVATTKLIQRFRPELLAMVGIAAGVPSRVELGDVIVADPVWDWGSGKWTTRDSHLIFLPSPHQVDIDLAIRNRFRRLASDSALLARIKAAFLGPKPASELRIRVGPMASGAAVLADGETIARIMEQNRDVVGVDMEAYGVLAAALESTTPRPKAFVVKGVVDFADGRKDDSVQSYAAHCSAGVLRAFLEQHCVSITQA